MYEMALKAKLPDLQTREKASLLTFPACLQNNQHALTQEEEGSESDSEEDEKTATHKLEFSPWIYILVITSDSRRSHLLFIDD